MRVAITTSKSLAGGGTSRQGYVFFSAGVPTLTIALNKQGSADVSKDLSNVKIFGTDYDFPRSGWYRTKFADYYAGRGMNPPGRRIRFDAKFVAIDPVEESVRLMELGEGRSAYRVRDPGVQGRQRVEDLVGASGDALKKAQRQVAEELFRYGRAV